MKKAIKNILGYNFKTLIKFEVIYKILTTIIFVPLFLSLFHLITKVTGYSYLTLENIGSFLLNPLTLFFLLLLLAFITFYTIIDISTIIIILDNSYLKKKITVKNALQVAFQKSLRIFKPQNILMLFLVIFLIPFLNLGLSSSVITTIKIPEFITDFISNNVTLSILYCFLVVILFIILFRWLYAIHYFILEDCNFKEARRKSIKLSHKNKIKDFLKIIGTQLLFVLSYIIFIFLGIFLIILLYKLLNKITILGTLSITIIWLLIAVSYIIFILLSTPLSYAVISILYYGHKEKTNEKIIHSDLKVKNEKQSTKRFRILKYVVIILVVFSSTLFTYSVIKGKYDLNVEYVRLMEVTAHRGASVNFPENTMSAFKGAKDLGADWIELDVQQTKDGKIVVLHDTNLKRTTGVNKYTYELTYDEIKKLDAGSSFSEEFKGEKIPLLSEVLEFAKENNIKLNIELKPSGKEVDFEKMVVDLINEYNFKDNCVVTSQVYDVLENTKKYDKSIKTVYVMSLAYGDITSLEYADNFSIEASSVNKKLVKEIHNSGKEIYAWTVNTEESINNMASLNVDNIITDNITLAKDIIFKSRTSNVINEYVKLINNLFK